MLGAQNVMESKAPSITFKRIRTSDTLNYLTCDHMTSLQLFKYMQTYVDVTVGWLDKPCANSVNKSLEWHEC